MKKLMTATIIILPILLLAVLLVSGAVMSLMTHIYVDALEFTKNEAIILVMDDMNNPPTYDLGKEITVLPLKATNRSVDYIVDDENLIEVKDGIITAKFYGETYVTVTSRENKAVSVQRKVVITDDSVHKIVMNEGYLTDLYQGKSQQLSVKIYPAEADNKAIRWTSDNDRILQVGANGTVTAVGAGIATVTATSVDNPEATATAQIVCHSKIEDVSFDNSLVVTALPYADFPTQIDTFGSDATFTYSSGNEDVATVDASGRIVFREPGRVTITLTATDFGGNSVQATKEYISTKGYFVGPLFTEKEMLASDWSEENPVKFAQVLSGSEQEIEKLECLVDGIGQDCLDEDYIRQHRELKFKNGLPQFTQNIVVIVRAKLYDFKTDAITTYEDSFTISNAVSENSAKVTYLGEELSAGTPKEITFENIDQKIVLEVENLGALKIVVDDNAYVSADINGNKITLLSRKVCINQNIYISIGSKTYVLSLTVHAKAEGLNVYCDGRQLTDGGFYQTLLDTLTFTVKPKRSDDQQMTNGKIQYELDGNNTWLDVEGGTLTISTDLFERIKFRCDEQEFEFEVQKVLLQDFGFNVTAVGAQGQKQILCDVSSAVQQNDISLNLSGNIQDSVTIELLLSNEFLGGVGSKESFQKIFAVNLGEAQDWIADYDALTKQITIIFSGYKDFAKTITLSSGALQVQLELARVTIKQISFTGYDSNSPEDVYAGYQQVKVFAKKSYYQGSTVDYFKIPLSAFSDISAQPFTSASNDTITWKLSQYRGSSLEKTYTIQRGKKVTYNGTDYTIAQVEGKWVLTDSDGLVVSGDGQPHSVNITWVDVYSDAAEGMARVYFGDCLGLSESDVYNDYFGAFDDQSWTLPERPTDDKGGGIMLEPSANAYTFLKVEAGDGAEDGVNCHYNFNVLADDDVINVFDANGYYQNDRVVLQTDLYGEGELGESGQKYDDAKERGLFLTVIENLGKTIIYGNGYQVNFQAQNADLGSCSESAGISVERAYNTIIKCANPTNEINNKNQKMVLKMNYAYYCDLSYYYKFNPIGNAFYAKNTVFSCIPKAAIQLSKNESLYVENIVMVESGTGILMDNLKAQDVKIYFKGSADILGYANQTLLKNLNEMIAALYESIAPNVLNYFEWFGKESSASIDDIGGNIDKFYVNVLAFALSNLSEKTFMWGDNGYKKISEGAKLSNGSKIINKELAFVVYNALTYETLNDSGTRLDNSSVSLSSKTIYADADMDSLFTDERYIRLLCEFKDDGVKNEAHILWHKQQAYRDPSLIKGRIQDHIEDLKNSLIYTGEGEDKQLTGIEWKTNDGNSNGGIDTSGNPYPASVQAATINEIIGLMKYTIDTRKKIA